MSTDALLSRLKDCGYQDCIGIIAGLRDPRDFDLANARLSLEAFVRETALLSGRLQGVHYTGASTNFTATVAFLADRGWLSTSEQKFALAYFGLVSDAVAHPGASLVESEMCRHSCLYLVNLVSARICDGLPGRRRSPRSGLRSAERLRIVQRFLGDLRSGAFDRTLIGVSFDGDLMDLARTQVKGSDGPLLLGLIRDVSAAPGLRNRAASIVLAPELMSDPATGAQLVAAMIDCYKEAKECSHWRVQRGIGLALANRANYPDCLLDYLEHVVQDEGLLEENLMATDEYYGSSDEAIVHCTARLLDRYVNLGQCVWEAVYVSRRACLGDPATETALKRRTSQAESQIDDSTSVRMLCRAFEDALNYLKVVRPTRGLPDGRRR